MRNKILKLESNNSNVPICRTFRFVDSDKTFVVSDRSGGFTVIELLVAMSVFIILISIVSGVFVSSLRTQRMAVALIAANNNASLTMEQMAREMRTGTLFSQTSEKEIIFTNARGELTAYHWNNSAPGEEYIERSINNETPKKLTADNVWVKNLNFKLFNGSPEHSYPNRITIVIQISPSNIVIAPVINLQTTISSRVFRSDPDYQ